MQTAAFEKQNAHHQPAEHKKPPPNIKRSPDFDRQGKQLFKVRGTGCAKVIKGKINLYGFGVDFKNILKLRPVRCSLHFGNLMMPRNPFPVIAVLNQNHPGGPPRIFAHDNFFRFHPSARANEFILRRVRQCEPNGGRLFCIGHAKGKNTARFRAQPADAGCILNGR